MFEIRGTSTRTALISAWVLLFFLAGACNTDKTDEGAQSDAASQDGKAVTPTEISATAAGTPEPVAADEPTHGTGAAIEATTSDEAAGVSTGDTGGKAPETTPGSAPSQEEEKSPIEALVAEIKQPKTSDARALAALAEAEKAGAKVANLAKVAHARGLALHDHPERAKVFFEWAADKAPKYPEPTFNLAKQAAVAGDVPEVRRYLKQTHERGGHQLLQQIDFDPMWEIVKDDPEVRELLK